MKQTWECCLEKRDTIDMSGIEENDNSYIAISMDITNSLTNKPVIALRFEDAIEFANTIIEEVKQAKEARLTRLISK